MAMKYCRFFIFASLTIGKSFAFHNSIFSHSINPLPDQRHQTLRELCQVQSMSSAAASSDTSDKSYLYDPLRRNEYYDGNIAQYLLDLNEEEATFDFCGGMMFQLVLTEKLKSHLQEVAAKKEKQPVVHPSSQSLMSAVPHYEKSSYADNTAMFHGREIRRVSNAKGGMGFVLQLSYSDPHTFSNRGSNDGKAVDPEGWSLEEISTYDGWRSDSFRKWRKASTYESEGYHDFSLRFGKEAFGLNHRFYLHLDSRDRLWLSAEDGCEGTPKESGSLLRKLSDVLLGRQ